MSPTFKNLNYFNLEQKCDDVPEFMNNDRTLSVAQYWGTNSAIDEPNIHMLYSSLLDRLEEPVFYKMVIFETLRNIRILLYADKRIGDFSHRIQLQNLGHWLGMNTLGRNKPILHTDIDIKALLVDMYNKGPHELFYVVPFVTRILTHCAYSRIFRPPNPWTMSIIHILAEIGRDPNLAVDLQFEIEFLCQILSIDTTYPERTSYLKNPVQQYSSDQQLSYDIHQIQMNNGELQQYYWDRSILKQVVDITSERHISRLPNQSAEKVRSQFHYLDISTFGMAQNADHLTIKDTILLFQIFPHMVLYVIPAIEEAICECFEEVLMISMSAALKSSEYSVQKDSALDPQGINMRMAALYMVCSFAAGLSMMNCGKNIVVLMKNKLFEAFCERITLTPPLLDFAKEAAEIVAADNMKLACVFMQKKVIEIAVSEMDRFLLIAMELHRIRCQEERYYLCDTSAEYQAENMADRLILKESRIIAQQTQIYEKFLISIPGFASIRKIQTIPASNSDNHLSAHNGCVDPILEIGFQQRRVRDVFNPLSILGQSEDLLRKWISLYHSVDYIRDPQKTSDAFIYRLEMARILSRDDNVAQFFETTTRLCIDLSNHAMAQPDATSSAANLLCFRTVDAFVRLVVSLIKMAGGRRYNIPKVKLLNQVLRIVADVLLQDHGTNGINFNQLPYHRILILLFLELYTIQSVCDQYSFEIVLEFCRILHILRPLIAPGFFYAWLDIIGDRAFLERVMNHKSSFACLEMYARILTNLFEFLVSSNQNEVCNEFFFRFYNGTVQIVSVLLHEFPLILCYYSDHFCDILPLKWLHLRNVILSACPKDQYNTDSSFPALQLDILNGIFSAPQSAQNRSELNMSHKLVFKLNDYLDRSKPKMFLRKLQRKLMMPSGCGTRYDVILVNAVVRFVGTHGLTYIQTERDFCNKSTFPHTIHVRVFQFLVRRFDETGNDILFNAIVNNLRYLNSRTYYYICTLLYLFSTAPSQKIQEQITKILLDRLLAEGPHPWGLRKTFTELIDNPFYEFWTRRFVKRAPKIVANIRSVQKWCRV